MRRWTSNWYRLFFLRTLATAHNSSKPLAIDGFRSIESSDAFAACFKKSGAAHQLAEYCFPGHGAAPDVFEILTSYLILFDTTSRIAGDLADQRLAPPSGNLTPPRISPSCPYRDRSTNAGAVIARQIGHDLLSGRSDPLPTLLAAFMQILCTGGSSRSLQCRCPFSVFTRHTNGCISVSGYSLRKVHEKAFSGFQKSSPHY